MLLCGRAGPDGAPALVEVEGARIAAIVPCPGEPPELALGGPNWWLAPALIDVQVNGFAGHDLNARDATPADVGAVTRALWTHAVGLWCPTVTTGAPERMARSLATVHEAAEQDAHVAAAVPALHLEGPWIATEDGPRGAHPLEHVREPHWDEFRRLQDAAGGRIGIVTLAPERPGALALIERLARAGVVAAIGHTAASPDQIADAVRAGARMSTHLGNAAHAELPRHPNYIWTQLAEDALTASLIADGHHLPPEFVRCAVRCKGVERTILVSDAIACAGMPPGTYSLGDTEVALTPDGRAGLPGTPFLVGAAVGLDRCVLNAAGFAAIPVRAALDMATANPARLLGIEDRVGALSVGAEATLMLCRPDADGLGLHSLFVRGQPVVGPRAPHTT